MPSVDLRTTINVDSKVAGRNCAPRRAGGVEEQHLRLRRRRTDDARAELEPLILLGNSASRKENTDQRVEKEVERDRETEPLPCSETPGHDWLLPVSSGGL